MPKVLAKVKMISRFKDVYTRDIIFARCRFFRDYRNIQDQAG